MDGDVARGRQKRVRLPRSRRVALPAVLTHRDTRNVRKEERKETDYCHSEFQNRLYRLSWAALKLAEVC